MRTRLWHWLHRTGIARAVNSGTTGNRPDVDQLLHAHRWTPRPVIAWVARQDFLHMYASKAAHLHLAQLKRLPITANGTRRWRAHWRPSR